MLLRQVRRACTAIAPLIPAASISRFRSSGLKSFRSAAIVSSIHPHSCGV